MKALGVAGYGPPERLQLCDLPVPAPGAGEVRIAVRAASVNDWDYQIPIGSLANRLMGGLLRPRVRILGCDVAGVVAEVGDGVTRFSRGHAVYGDLSSSGFGAFAEYVCAPETALAPKPDTMGFAQAAAIPQAGMLAYQALFDSGGIRRGQKLLFNGAGGGVGTLGLQMARTHEDIEITVVDRASKLDMLRELGADHVIDYRVHDFTRGEARYDRIVDTKTNRSPFAYARVLVPGGTYATVGGRISRLLQVALLGQPMRRLLGKHVQVVVLRPNRDLERIGAMFEAGALEPVIGRSFELGEAPEALQHFGTGEHQGKVIITMN